VHPCLFNGSCRPSASAAAASEAVHEVVEGIASASIPAPSMLSSSNGKTNVTDFGQTFPTPRESTAVACSTSTMSVEEAAAASAASAATNSVEKRFPSEKKAHRSNNLVPSNATNAATSVKSRKPHRSPLSYYLPLPKKHSLIKDARLRSHSQDNNKENKAPNRLSEPEPEQVEKEPLSLQESLQKKRPEFIQRSQLRKEVLEQIRAHRLIHAEKYKIWLIEVSKLPEVEAMKARLAPPSLPKIPRLFSYREMVTQAREKYQRLPEIVYSKAEAKRKTSYKTNRLKADMYKKKLQRKVLQGRVSLAHHNQILADL